MLVTRKRHQVFKRKVNFADMPVQKVLIPTEVAVLNPYTKEDEIQIVNTYIEENLLDPHLKASDFSLQIQLRNGQQLKDCGFYLSPSTPEEYNALLHGFAGRFEEQLAKLRQPKVSPEPTPDPTPVSTPVSTPEPPKTE